MSEIEQRSVEKSCERISEAARLLSEGKDLANAKAFQQFTQALIPFVERELIVARISEARETTSSALTIRIKRLAKKLAKCETHIPVEYRL